MEQLGIYDNEEKEILSNQYRPLSIDDFFGQDEAIKIIKKMLDKKELVNLIIYGPSGSGKTTISKIIAKELGYYFEYVNATNTGIARIKELSKISKDNYNTTGKKTLLLLDEIHRFNKLQQDSLLEDIEIGKLILVSTTTENPYYSLNKAIISRCIVIKFDKLSDNNIVNIINNVAKKSNIKLDDEIINYILSVCSGDARVALNILDLIIKTDLETVKSGINIAEKYSASDKYDRISAMIKSIRGSDVDATVYWLASLLNSGEDVSYIARRLVISASEDIGLANPNAMNIASSALIAVEKIGMPEARIILSNCAIYLALSPKSNSSYNAINKAILDIQENGTMDIPIHLKPIGKDKYLYPHNYKNNYVKQKYLSKNKVFYNPSNNKNERAFNDYWEKIKKESENGQ